MTHPTRLRNPAFRFVIGCALCVALAGLTGANAHAQAEHKFATAMFHFNVQYVAGGMEGFLPFGFEHLFTEWELNEKETEDMIIVESFEPVLDLYLEHPGWGVDLEMQAYMVEVMAERHPGVLDKLKTLADRGQASVVSFHYSDQLFIGYGRPAWEHSVQEAQRVFEEHGVPLSTTVFCQEGQAGMGMASAMADYNYQTMVWPKNLWIYQHGDWDAQPYYAFGDLDLVAGSKGVDYNDGENIVKLTWTFLGDGELLATCDLDPYFPPIFKRNQGCLQEYVDRLQAAEDEGWDIATVEEYVEAVKALDIQPAELPPLFDGTWQPGSTKGVLMWLGRGGIWRNDERDNHVRTSVAIAYRELMAAQTIAEVAQLDNAEELREAWRLMALGMVTDATGINPYKGEIGYGVSRAAEVAWRSREIIRRGKEALSITGTARIDTQSGTVEQIEAPAESTLETQAPIDRVIATGGREYEEKWYAHSDDPEIFRLDINVAAGQPRFMFLSFPGSGEVTFTPALADDQPVTYTKADFAFEDTDWPMPLANGMISLSDGWFAVKDQAYTHIAAIIYNDKDNVVFYDETANPDSAFTWRFYLLHAEVEEAVDFANGLNVYPTLYR
jgi:hypothetical protein